MWLIRPLSKPLQKGYLLRHPSACFSRAEAETRASRRIRRSSCIRNRGFRKRSIEGKASAVIKIFTVSVFAYISITFSLIGCSGNSGPDNHDHADCSKDKKPPAIASPSVSSPELLRPVIESLEQSFQNNEQIDSSATHRIDANGHFISKQSYKNSTHELQADLVYSPEKNQFSIVLNPGNKILDPCKMGANGQPLIKGKVEEVMQKITKIKLHFPLEIKTQGTIIGKNVKGNARYSNPKEGVTIEKVFNSITAAASFTQFIEEAGIQLFDKLSKIVR